MALRTPVSRMVESSGVQQTFRPQMTSLIDILTLLLVFLIQSFSAEGELITAAEDLQLPETSSHEPAKPALMIEVSSRGVSADGQFLSPLKPVESDEGMEVPQLSLFFKNRMHSNSDTSHVKEVILQCDRNLSFRVVKKIMATCSRAGFDDFTLLAIQKE